MALDTGDGGETDEVLVARYGAGDRVAARLLTMRLVPRLLGFARRMLGGDQAEAEDVVQETLMRLWKAAPGWQPGEMQVKAWIYRVAGNLCTDRLRAQSRRRHQPMEAGEEVADGGASVAAQMLARDRMAALQAGLDALPERQRQAVILRHIEGLSNPEIAGVMEIGVAAVESLTARGKRALAAVLAGQKAALGYEDEGV